MDLEDLCHSIVTTAKDNSGYARKFWKETKYCISSARDAHIDLLINPKEDNRHKL